MPRRSRAPGERAGLHPGDIIVAAMALSKQHGLKGLTMRRLAAELGVTANTLYSYFPSKRELVAALIDRLIGEVEVYDAIELDWQKALFRMLEQSRSTLLAHHELIPLFLAEPTTGPNALRLSESMLVALEKGGLTGKLAVEALRILLIYTFGFAAMEAPRLKRPPAGVKASRREHPRTAAHDRYLSRHPDEALFNQGLVWILDGISAWTAKDRSGAYTLR